MSFTNVEILSRGRFVGLGRSFFLFFVVYRKIISMLLKDLDVFARNSIKDELASLGSALTQCWWVGRWRSGRERATKEGARWMIMINSIVGKSCGGYVVLLYLCRPYSLSDGYSIYKTRICVGRNIIYDGALQSI